MTTNNDAPTPAVVSPRLWRPRRADDEAHVVGPKRRSVPRICAVAIASDINLALHVQQFDGTSLSRSDATFCPQLGKDGKGNSFRSVNDPTKYIRYYYGKLYIASDGDSTNPWDTTALWTDDVSFIVSPPWSP